MKDKKNILIIVLVLIILVILVLFGPKKIPEIAQMVGKGMRKVKEAQAQFQSQINEIEHEIKAPLSQIKNEYENLSSPYKVVESQPLVDSINNTPVESHSDVQTMNDNESENSHKTEDK